MSQFDVREDEERFGALADFTRNEKEERAQALTIPASSFGAPAERVFGAQQVAVHRDERRVLQKLSVLAEAAGSDWYYRFPVKNRAKGTTDWIEGPSIKLANDLARTYGNCDVDCRVQDVGPHWIFYARFTDFETGYSLTRPFQQRKNQRSVGGDADRALDIAMQIGASKAIRNVTTNALQTFADYAFEQAKNALIEKIGKNLQGYRNRTVERLADLVDLKRVEAVVGRPAPEWLAPDVARVIAMAKAITDGMSDLDETFPPLEAKPAGDQQAEPKPAGKPADLDAFAGKAEQQDAKPKAARATKAKPAEKPTEEAHHEQPAAQQQAADQAQQASPRQQDGAVADQHPQIDERSPDYARGRQDFAEGVRKCLKTEIRENPQRFANWQAGYGDAKAENEGA